MHTKIRITPVFNIDREGCYRLSLAVANFVHWANRHDRCDQLCLTIEGGPPVDREQVAAVLQTCFSSADIESIRLTGI